jgi:hypothetical protein
MPESAQDLILVSEPGIATLCDVTTRSKVVMVDSGHFIPLNNPEVVAAELLSSFGSAANA